MDIITKHWDEFLRAYYWQECGGCPDGHNSFWKTIIESPEWEKWKKYNKGTNWDWSECEELGIMSVDHWKAFVRFIKRSATKSK